MTECKQQVFGFQALKSRKVTVDFTGGYLSSDEGGLFLREVEERHRIIAIKGTPITKYGSYWRNASTPWRWDMRISTTMTVCG